MNLYINNLSALRFYSMAEFSLDDLSSPCGKTVVGNAVGSLTALKEFDLSEYGLGSGRLHVIVGDQSKRSSTNKIVCHVRSKPLPRGSFRKLDDHVYISSPEYCFYELAHTLSFPKLVEFGYLLCGTYTMSPTAAEKNKRAELTDKRRLLQFADCASQGRKHKTIDDAINLVIEGSASPRETKLAMLLVFPVKRGGYGFPAPVLNHRIDFTPEERELFGRPYVILDLYWPEFRFGIEYDGLSNHSSDTALTRDRKKVSELDYKGIKVYSVDKWQLANVQQVYALARKVARAIHCQVRKPTAKQWAAKQELFNELMRRQGQRANDAAGQLIDDRYLGLQRSEGTFSEIQRPIDPWGQSPSDIRDQSPSDIRDQSPSDIRDQSPTDPWGQSPSDSMPDIDA